MPDNCAQYIDCNVVSQGGSSADPVQECTYPDLFSTLSMTCQHFTTVTCDTRMEPQAPCKYDVIHRGDCDVYNMHFYEQTVQTDGYY